MTCLITGAVPCFKELKKHLTLLNHTVVFMQNENEPLPISPEKIDMAFCNGLFLHHNISLFKNLKYIQLTSAGYDRLDLAYTEKNGIKVFNAKGVYGPPMAEFALAGVLNFYKGFPLFLKNQKSHSFIKNRQALELCDKEVLIVGAGNIGTECAKRFKAMNTKVFGVDLYPFESELFEKIYPLNSLKAALTTADIVILTLPLTPDTKYLFDKSKFKKMKDNALFVNIARGAIVKTENLIWALNTKLMGAVLDVFEEEPLDENSPLWDLENVIITPHNSFIGDKNKDRLLKVMLANLNNK